MNARVLAFLSASLSAACGGSVSVATADAGASPPDANVYLCDAARPGAVGCTAGPPDAQVLYPLGCMARTTLKSAYCVGSQPYTCPLMCVCQVLPNSDGGPVFICAD